MRLAMVVAAIIGFAGSAIAGDAPTMDQCKSGWKADYSKMWTKADFTKACAAMTKNSGKM